MKSTVNQVSFKKAPIDLSNDSMINIELAQKALAHLTVLVQTGKNASVLAEVANHFANKKETATIKALRKDNVLKGLESKVFQCQTAVKARSMTQADNYFDYCKVIKAVLSKKVPLNEKQCNEVKTIVAKAQVLRNGYLSRYAHGEISFQQLAGHYGIEEKAPESVTDSAEAPAATAQSEEQSASIDMGQLKAMIDSIELFEDAELALELIQGKMKALALAAAERVKNAS